MMRCESPPSPIEAKLSLSGFFFEYSTSSASVFTGTFLLRITICWPKKPLVTGSKSLSGS